MMNAFKTDKQAWRVLFLLFDLLLILAVALLLWHLWVQFIQPYTLNKISVNTSSIPLNNDWDDIELPDFPDQSLPPPKLRPVPPPHVAALLDSVYEQTQTTLFYNPDYIKIDYPGGDVDAIGGVCTDVIVRAFRAQGVDLQQAVHEDMRRSFKKYPQKWGLKQPDTNIDHRRVPNLATFFERQGKSLPISDNPEHYQPGDIVVWQLNKRQQHIGIVMKSRSRDELRPLIGHNINSGTKIQDVLLNWPIIGHYRWFEPLLAETEKP